MRPLYVLPTLLLSALLLQTPPLHACELKLDGADRSQTDKNRDAQSLPCAMTALVPLKPGAVVLDLLGGGGYFSELLAQQVGPQGKVYLHNNKAYLPYVEQQLQSRLADNRLANVQRLDREVDDLQLTANSLDAVYFIMGYHDMYHVAQDWRIAPDNLMQQVLRALKPGGLMLVVDHNAPTGSGVAAAQELHRIEAAYVRQELQQFGFVVTASSDALQNPADNYNKSAFDAAVRGKTDRFVFVAQKPTVK